MQRNFTPEFVGRRFGVTKATVIGWIEAGLIPAVNVATAEASRSRWRMSEDDIEVFETRRQSQQAGAAP